MRREHLLLLGSLALPACQGDHLAGTPESEVAPVPAASATEAFAGARVTDRFPTPTGTLSVMPLDHASFILGWEGKAIYVDPARPNAHEGSVDDARLPQADAILITDPHYDHLDPLYVARLRQPRTVVVGPEAAAARAPIDVVLRNGETRALLGLEVTAVPSYNLTRGPVAAFVTTKRDATTGTSSISAACVSTSPATRTARRRSESSSGSTSLSLA